jgi:hypothetical protein
LQDGAALATHLADKAAGHGGTNLSAWMPRWTEAMPTDCHEPARRTPRDGAARVGSMAGNPRSRRTRPTADCCT